MKTARSKTLWLAWCTTFVFAMFTTRSAQAFQTIVINELDSDTPSTPVNDSYEFIELYDGGAGNTSLTGYVLVFYNGSNDQSYLALDLDGKSTNASGYFVAGNANIVNNLGGGFGASNWIQFNDNTLQNGADAVGLYTDDGSNFPNGTAITTTNLVDAVVYDTADADDAGLLPLLNANQPEVDEAGGPNGSANDSIFRCPNGAGGLRNTANYLAGVPTPGVANTSSCPPSGVTGACCLPNETCQVVTPTDCTNLGGTFAGFDEICYPQRCGPTGACCLPWGVCEIHSDPECTGYGGIYQGDGTTCSPSTCTSLTGACCTGTSCSTLTRSACIGAGNIFLGEGTTCTPNPCAPDYSGLKINELRVDQPGGDNDEYFEIYNSSASARSLNGLTYIVIGDATDAPQPDNSGVIESVTELAGTIPSHGYFLVAQDANTFGVMANEIATFNFENNGSSDNYTHLLVSGFYGINGQDLDSPDNCSLDTMPWAAIVDRVACIVSSNGINMPPPNTECSYGLNGVPPNTIGPDGSFPPAHAFRIPDGGIAANTWHYRNEFTPANASDTPGAMNVEATGACCDGTDCYIDTMQNCFNATNSYLNWKGKDTVCGEGNAICNGACCYCTDSDPWCETWACTVTSAANCRDNLGGTFQGDGIPCSPDPGSFDCSQCYTIYQARQLFTGTPIGVKLCNVRISSVTNLISGGSASFQIQDASGPGSGDDQSALTVFGTSGPSGLITGILNSAQEGDLIDIQGTLQSFNGLLELANSSVRALGLVHNYNVAEVIPPAISIPGADFQDANPTAENRESEIVKLDCVTFVNPPGTTFAASTNYTVTDGANNVTVRIVTASPPLNIVGATIPTGPCSITGIFSQFGSPTTGYQLLPRSTADVGSPTCPGPLAACCYAGGLCRDDLNETLCNGIGGNFFSGTPTCSPGPTCLTVDDVRINEIRMDQPSTDNDEYFELRGTPTTPLGSLTYIVIGDGSGGSGTIETVRFLTGKKIPADGYFLAARTTYSLGGTPDDSSDFVDFENDDNTTHMIVENFTGTNGMDLDTPDDGILDANPPWSRILDSVAVVKQLNPNPMVDGNEYYYSTNIVGPAGNVSPFHVLRCPPSDAWVIGTEDTNTNGGNDTPGTANPNVCPCACPADRNADGKINGLDVSNFANMLVGNLASDPCADINQDGAVNYSDTAPFVDLVLQGGSCSGDFSTGIRVVSYNLLQYNGGASADRKTAFKRILNALRPDVLAAQELSGGGANDFLNNVLNAADGPSPGGYALASYTGGDEAIYYRTARISYSATPVDGTDFGSVATLPRATPWRYFGVVGQDAGKNFYVYNAHLKAGSVSEDSANPTTRDTAAVLIRADMDTRNGAQVIFAGDMNFYSSDSPPGNEPAWSTLTVAGDADGQMLDPIATPGAWDDNSSFAAIHTQSPHANGDTDPVISPAPPGAIGGGMDSRFDFVFINAALSDVTGLSYLGGTYKAYGNDGLHFNNDINDPPVIPQGQVIADSLHMAADHIPVVMELKINP